MADRNEVIEAQLADIVAEIGQLKAVLAEDGVTSLGSRGQVVAHPALNQIRAHRWLAIRYLDGLAGVRPASGPDWIDTLRAEVES